MKEILRLGEILKEKGITGQSLANDIGVHPGYVSQLVTNRKFPSKETILKICEVLDIDIKELFHSLKATGPVQALHEIRRIADQALALDE